MKAGSSIRARHGHQSGVSLVEIMVAVLVLSIGLLGLAGLQLRTLRNNQSALERGVAVVETYAIADAMRADRIGADNDRFNIALTDAAPSGATFPETAVRSWRNNLVASIPDIPGISMSIRITSGILNLQFSRICRASAYAPMNS